MGETNHDAIFARVQKLFERMHQNQKLQKLAKENGMDVKNNAELTDDTINNLAVSIIALSLAKDANDPRYGKLVNTGLQKRSLKIEIINDYKDEANRLIGEYNNGNFQEMTKGCDATENFQEGFLDIFKPKPTNTTATNYNPNNGSGSEKQNWKRVACEVASKWIDKNLPTDVSKLINGDTDKNFDNKYFEIKGCKYTFKKNMYDVTNSEDLGDWLYNTLTKEFLLYHSGEIDNTDDLESLFETYKDEIPCLHIIEGELSDNTEYVIAYDFALKEYFMFKHDDVYTDKRNDIKLGKSWTSFMKSLKDE